MINELIHFLEECNDGIVIYEYVNGYFCFNYANIVSQTLDNYNINYVKNKRVIDIFPGIVESGLYEIFKKVYETGEKDHFDIYYKDKRIEGVRYNSIYRIGDKLLVRYNDKKIRGIQNKYKKSLDSAPVGIFIIDNNYNLTYVNNSFVEIIDIQNTDNIVGKNIKEFLMIQNNINDFDEIEIKTINNKILNVKTIILDDIEFLGFCVDITKLKEYDKFQKLYMKELEISKDQSEQSEKLKMSFLSNVTHEIRTPLNSILGFSKLISESTNKQERNKYLSIIERNSESLLNLIDDIIDLSKLESNMVYINSDNCVLLDIMSDVYFKNKDKFDDNVDFYIDENLPNTIIYTDKNRLIQVLNILVSNSIKFTEQGHVKIGYSIKKGTVIFYVEDTGIGILEDNFDMIFNRFTQIDERDSKIYQGAGLGLSLIKNIIKLLGGKVWLESEIGKGTTFYFSIPSDYIHRVENQYEHIFAENINWSNNSILIIMENINKTPIIEPLLRKTNINIDKSDMSPNSIKKVYENDYDMVIINVNLPNETAENLVNKIKEIKNIPVMGMSNYVLINSMNDLMKKGFDNIITNPIDTYLLIKTINKYLD